MIVVKPPNGGRTIEKVQRAIHLQPHIRVNKPIDASGKRPEGIAIGTRVSIKMGDFSPQQCLYAAVGIATKEILSLPKTIECQ